MSDAIGQAIWQEAENEAGPGGAGPDLRAPLLPQCSKKT